MIIRFLMKSVGLILYNYHTETCWINTQDVFQIWSFHFLSLFSKMLLLAPRFSWGSRHFGVNIIVTSLLFDPFDDFHFLSFLIEMIESLISSSISSPAFSFKSSTTCEGIAIIKLFPILRSFSLISIDNGYPWDILIC